MTETNATILIPDISGFTEFMTTTELTHSAHAVNYLIEAIIEAVGDQYEVAEIEGDAVLLIKKGEPPSRKEIQETCIKIFNAFHFRRKWMQLHTVCPCGACQAIINLSLKFVVHHGPLVEMKIGNFVKQAGREMIVAHRLLKNSINSSEYVLVTEELLKHADRGADFAEMEWNSSSEVYASIGKINYEFTLLNEARKKVPEPPEPEYNYRTDTTDFLEMTIQANYFDVYMILKNIPERSDWVPDLLKVEQEFPEAFIGSIHHCTYQNFKGIISPLKMLPTEEGVMYAESFKVDEWDLSLVIEYVFKKLKEDSCSFGCRYLNINKKPIEVEINDYLFNHLHLMAQRLKLKNEQSA